MCTESVRRCKVTPLSLFVSETIFKWLIELFNKFECLLRMCMSERWQILMIARDHLPHLLIYMLRQ